MRVFPALLWQHRRVLLLCLVLAEVIAVAIVLSRPRYTSSSQVLLPLGHPVGEVSEPADRDDLSVLDIGLGEYAGHGLEADVRTGLGPEASELRSLGAKRGPDPDYVRLTASASAGATTARALELAASLLIGKSTAIAQEQVDLLEREVAAQVAPLEERRRPVDAAWTAKQADSHLLQSQIHTLENSVGAARQTALSALSAATSGSSALATAAELQATDAEAQIRALTAQLASTDSELNRVTRQITAIDAERARLDDLVYQAGLAYRDWMSTPTVSEPPSTPITSVGPRVRVTIALALVVGLAVAGAAVAWLERATLRARMRETISAGPLPGARAVPTGLPGVGGPRT